MVNKNLKVEARHADASVPPVLSALLHSGMVSMSVIAAESAHVLA